jgi:flagellar protein FlaF
MGFSVSGSAVIIFVGVFIGLGMFYTATSNSFERVSDAQEGQTEKALTEGNTDIVVKAAEYDAGSGRLTVLVNNTGSSALAVNRTDFLVDNEYIADWEANARVNGATGTDLWLPGEQLNITIRTTSDPSRVKVVSEAGVADTETEVLPP